MCPRIEIVDLDSLLGVPTRSLEGSCELVAGYEQSATMLSVRQLDVHFTNFAAAVGNLTEQISSACESR
jgi:hypothetical protein